MEHKEQKNYGQRVSMIVSGMRSESDGNVVKKFVGG